MVQAFPELRIAKGMVLTIEKMEWYQHQWCVDQDNRIVDPTADQWTKIIEYKEIKSEDAKPIGKCPNCGEWIFEGGYSTDICSEKCKRAYLAYLNSGVA